MKDTGWKEKKIVFIDRWFFERLYIQNFKISKVIWQGYYIKNQTSELMYVFVLPTKIEK